MMNRTKYCAIRAILLVLATMVSDGAEAFQMQMGHEPCKQPTTTTSPDILCRRDILASLIMCPIIATSNPVFAAEEQQVYTRTPSPSDKFKFSYTILTPPSFEAGTKPLKTHLDEINFSPPDVRGYTVGVTVDPVRIGSIQEFGTPEEVAARVVTAEVNRDGVFEVTLAKDPVEDAAGCYDIEYISDGKRGKKRFSTRIYIKDGFLYVLTVQSKEAEFDTVRAREVQQTVKSFRPL